MPRRPLSWAVADGMATVFVSTTWPCHVSLVTGVSPRTHGVVSNHILNRATTRVEDFTGDPIYDAADLVRAPTFYDRAHAAGLRTAAIDWPATRHAASLDFSLPFFKNQQIFETHTAPAVWKELRALGYPVERQGEWAELPRRFLKDAMVADLAVDVLRRHAPDVLLVHFLCADSHQHLYGPRSPEAYWAIAYIDGLVGRVLLALGPDGLDRTAVVVVSDHGFLPVTREIRPNVRLRRRGLLRVADDGGVARAEARFVMNLGAGWVYALGGGDRERLARDLRGELAALEGVAAVWTPQEYASLGLPGPAAPGLRTPEASTLPPRLRARPTRPADRAPGARGRRRRERRPSRRRGSSRTAPRRGRHRRRLRHEGARGGAAAHWDGSPASPEGIRGRRRRPRQCGRGRRGRARGVPDRRARRYRQSPSTPRASAGRRGAGDYRRTGSARGARPARGAAARRRRDRPPSRPSGSAAAAPPIRPVAPPGSQAPAAPSTRPARCASRRSAGS